MNNSVDINVLKDFDTFFYYDQNDLGAEIKSDVMANIMQGKRSLFYNRSLDSAGIPDYENFPDGLTLRINVPYDIVNSISKRNQYVSNGQNEKKDRRVAVSQSTIKIDKKQNSKGEIDITVLYIAMHDFKQTESLTTSLGLK